MLQNGHLDCKDASPATAIARIRDSGLFDAAFYALANPDLTELGERAVAHYCLQGWRENRKPNFYFDPAWYLRQYEDVRTAGLEPLLHYLVRGEAEGRRPCPLFDPGWYGLAHAVPEGVNRLAHLLANRCSGRARAIAEFDAGFYLQTYPDIANAGIDPFEHYLVQGFREARRPFDGFDPQFYRHRYLRGMPDANPLLHFIAHRGESGIHPSLPPGETTIGREVRRNTGPNEAFETRVTLPSTAIRRARVLAYYLPQYHPVAENDAWWGDGFTEWTNIARTLPRYAGHYQPRVPRDLGHYRLDAQSAVSTLQRQIEFARGAAIDGFVFYFYWFNGKRLLEGPLEALLADATLDFPFCLMWTNENWTRRWDGSSDEILIGQDYGSDDEDALLACFARHFADPRYIRLDGRPLLMVYRPALIPQAARAVARWRAALGEDAPILVMSQSFGDLDPRPFGFDGAIEFPPHKICDRLPVINPSLDILDSDFHAHVYDYRQVVHASLAEPAPDYPLIKTAVPSWDNDARRQGGGLVLHGSSPSLYQNWLEQLVLRASDHPFFGEPIVCINAWNEWAEGAYLEPDLHFGAAYLNATGRAITGAAKPERLLLVGHDGLRHGAQLLLLEIARRLVHQHGAAIDVVLLGQGPLESEFAQLGPTRAFDDHEHDALALHLRRLKRDGMSAALVNSLASSAVCALLDELRIPYTLLAHEGPGLLREKRLLSQATAALTHANEVVVAAPEIALSLGQATGYAHERALILPQGTYRRIEFSRPRRAALRQRMGIAHDDLVVLGLGYADIRKGFDLFVQLWRLIRDRTRRSRRRLQAVHFVWAGGMDPDLRQYLGAEIEAAIETGQFHLPGFVDDPSDMLSLADCHALTSREDPFPSVVLEAIAAGLSTIAFEGTGGIPALLRREALGQVVPRGDVTAFAEALMTAAAATTSPGAREQRLSVAPRFCFDEYARRLLHLARPKLLDVSVVILSFNYACYMSDRMNSVLAQLHPVREVIVIDDASTDDSIEIATAAAAAQRREIRLIASSTNSGSPFGQWRQAVIHAHGEWLWIAEADDMAEPRFLEILADRLAEVPDAVLGFTDSRVIDHAGKPTDPSYQNYYRESACALLAHDGVHAGPDFLRSCLSERNLIMNASAVLFRRSALAAALERCAQELQALRVAGDWRIYAEMLQDPASRVVYVAAPLNVHRRHDTSVTHRLAARQHLVEISQVHNAVARLGGISEQDRARQRAYRSKLRSQFGLRVAAR